MNARRPPGRSARATGDSRPRAIPTNVAIARRDRTPTTDESTTATTTPRDRRRKRTREARARERASTNTARRPRARVASTRRRQRRARSRSRRRSRRRSTACSDRRRTRKDAVARRVPSRANAPRPTPPSTPRVTVRVARVSRARATIRGFVARADGGYANAGCHRKASPSWWPLDPRRDGVRGDVHRGRAVRNRRDIREPSREATR